MKKIRTALIAVITVAAILTGALTVFADPATPPVTPPAAPSETLSITGYDYSGSYLPAGEAVSFQVQLSSTGTLHDVTVELSGFGAGVSLYKDSAEKSVPFGPTTPDATVNYVLQASERASTGFVNLTIKAKGYNASGDLISDETTATVYVVNEAEKEPEKEHGGLRIRDFALSSPTVEAGEDFALRVYIDNTSGATYDDVRVTVDATDPNGFTLIDSIESKYITVTSKNKENYVDFNINANSGMAAGRHTLRMSISYTSRRGTSGTDSATAFIPITAKTTADPDDENDSKPIILIDKYTFGDDAAVRAGERFPLSLTFKNVSNVAMQNIKITLSDTSGIFTPTASSNTLFIKSIPAGGTAVQELEFMAAGDAKVQSYTIHVDYEFEAFSGGKIQSFTAGEKISVPVQQTDRFEAGEMEYWGQVYMDQETYLNFGYVNKGKSTIYNLSVHIDGDFDVASGQNTYVGNVESGRADTVEMSIIPHTEGKQHITVTFSYEDSNNIEKTAVREFDIEVINPNAGMDMGGMGGMDVYPDGGPAGPMGGMDAGMEGEMPSAGLPVWAIVLIVIGAAAAVTVVIVLIVKAKKRKENQDEDL